MTADHEAPTWFRGVWKREWMKVGQEAPAETHIVRDVQTPSVFGSVRIPLSRPPISATSIDDLDDSQLRALLEQKGFAGIATFRDRVAVWVHAIDFRPASSEADTARLTQLGPSRRSRGGLQRAVVEPRAERRPLPRHRGQARRPHGPHPRRRRRSLRVRAKPQA
jgi:hypothetical protein